jgi:hypothetical protein
MSTYKCEARNGSVIMRHRRADFPDRRLSDSRRVDQNQTADRIALF